LYALFEPGPTDAKVLLCPGCAETEFNLDPVHLRLSAKSASQATMFFSYKKIANCSFSQSDQPAVLSAGTFSQPARSVLSGEPGSLGASAHVQLLSSFDFQRKSCSIQASKQ
jgi:hypothetical protein